MKQVGKYQLQKTIGQGTFSKVKRALDTETGEIVAIKVVDIQNMEREGMEKQIRREISVLKSMKHPNIVGLKEVLKSKHNIYLVMEFISGGELFDRIVQQKRFDEQTARKYFRELISGIEYCHSLGVAHRDLKPENLLLGDGDILKISDFGLSGIVDKNNRMLSTICGTPHYLAPEVLSGAYDGIRADVWSCGIILYVMATGRHPFDDTSVQGLFRKIQNLDFTYPSYLSADIRDLIDKILAIDPMHRITLSQIRTHKWMQDGQDRSGSDAAALDGPQSSSLEVPTRAQPAEPTNEDLANAVQEVVEQEKKRRKPVMIESLNAFELTSRLLSGLMSPLLTYKARNPPPANGVRSTKFFTSGNAEDTYNAVLLVINNDGGTIIKQKDLLFQVKAKLRSGIETIEIAVQIYPTMEVGVNMLEVSKTKGDTLKFHQFYRDFKEKVINITKRNAATAAATTSQQRS